MRNLPFVIWMVGAPMVRIFSSYVGEYLLEHTYTDGTWIVGTLFYLAMYVFIGTLLYEKKS